MPAGAGKEIASTRIDDAVTAILAAAGDASDLAPLFVTLPVAARLARQGGAAARGLFFPVELLHYSRYASLVPKELLLNDRFVMAPWRDLSALLPGIAGMFGTDRLFIRPDSPRKPFTGISGSVDWLRAEIPLLGQAERVAAHELVVIAPEQALGATEYRFWVVDGSIATAAPYGWDDRHQGLPVPDDAARVARAAAEALQYVETTFVADVGMTDKGPRLIELNAVSTSGWYAGMCMRSLVISLMRSDMELADEP